ncbi:MAG: hypothetical protein ACREFR_01060 [Limisphaerales bacterium]
MPQKRQRRSRGDPALEASIALKSGIKGIIQKLNRKIHHKDRMKSSRHQVAARRGRSILLPIHDDPFDQYIIAAAKLNYLIMVTTDNGLKNME